MAEAYLDACCIIYLLEGAPAWRAAVEARLRRLPPSTTFVTSRFSRLECRAKPLRDRDHQLLARYDATFAPESLRTLEVTASNIERATELRARHGFHSGDAIHLAAAIDAGAAVVVTGDATLARCSDVPVEVIQPLTVVP